MSKNISISDDVYEALRRRKRGRSFSETIREAVEASGGLSDVVGQRVLAGEALDGIKGEVKRLSRGTLKRLDEDADVADEAS